MPDPEPSQPFPPLDRDVLLGHLTAQWDALQMLTHSQPVHVQELSDHDGLRRIETSGMDEIHARAVLNRLTVVVVPWVTWVVFHYRSELDTAVGGPSGRGGRRETFDPRAALPEHTPGRTTIACEVHAWALPGLVWTPPDEPHAATIRPVRRRPTVL